MEKKTGEEIKKWDEVNGETTVETPRELPGYDSGKNPMRSIEDMIEQNDNQLDGIVNNLPEETVYEKEAKLSIVEQLKSMILNSEDEKKERKVPTCPDRELC